MERKDDESITESNRRFQRLIHDMPIEIRPSEATAKIYYIAAHHPNVAFYIREMRSLSLKQMFMDAEEIENNLWFFEQLLSQRRNDTMLSENQQESINDGFMHVSLCDDLQGNF